MKSSFIYFNLVLFTLCSPFSFKAQIKTTENEQSIVEVKDGFKKYYDEYGVTGSMIIYDQNANKYFYFNQAKTKEAYTPASTFKILNSLIGLETGIIKDENFSIKWDKKQHWNKNWNQDHTLRSAFKYSTVWYYQELARRVGGQKMKYWLDKTQYGNADTSGGIDRFWLSGGLRVTPEQQLTLLKQLYHNKLPFSQRSMDIVKNIMISDDSTGYVVRAKTGWGNQEDLEIGWYIGYAEINKNIYYFVNCIQFPSKEIDLPGNSDCFKDARKQIPYNILDTFRK